MRTRLTDAFGFAHPILCAPMALVTGGRLAAAVSAAGGLGIIGGGYAGILGGEPDLQQEIDLARGQKFGVGFITWALTRAPNMLDIRSTILLIVYFSRLAISSRSQSESATAARS